MAKNNPMTTQDFLYSMPSLIVHPTLGECHLEVLIDTPGCKIAGYRDKRHNLSDKLIGSSWQEVHDMMLLRLVNGEQIESLSTKH